MQMRIIIIALVLIVLLTGCSKKPIVNGWLYPPQDSDLFLIPEEKTFYVYAELNVLRVISSSLREVGNIDKEALVFSLSNPSGRVDDHYNPFFCPAGALGDRLFVTDLENVSLSAECIYHMRGLSSLEGVLQDALMRQVEMDTIDDRIHIFYAGDSLLIESGQVENHRRIKQNYLALKDDRGKRECVMKGPIYEFYLPLNKPYYSFVVRTDPKDLKGYKPLKLDPSILPLESPGYKKLREQEQALRRPD
ncbi:hypothetical protein [Fibrobacter sp.]